jgi:hypothetical protein
MAAQCRGTAKLDRRHGAALRCWERSAALLSVGLAVSAEHVRHFDRTGPHWGADAQKCSGGDAFGVTAAGRGSKSSGLDVEQTLLVAIRR